MSVSYEGKSPGRFWYFAQNMKAMASTPFNRATRPDAKKLGLNTLFSVGSFAIAWKVAAILMPLPIVPSVVAIAGATTGIGFAVGAWRRYKNLKASGAVVKYVRAKEDKWLQKKSRPPFLKRIQMLLSIKNMLNKFKGGKKPADAKTPAPRAIEGNMNTRPGPSDSFQQAARSTERLAAAEARRAARAAAPKKSTPYL